MDDSLLRRTASGDEQLCLQDAGGKPSRLQGHILRLEDLVPLIPPTAYRRSSVGQPMDIYAGCAFARLGKCGCGGLQAQVDRQYVRVGDAIASIGVPQYHGLTLISARALTFIQDGTSYWAWAV